MNPWNTNIKIWTKTRKIEKTLSWGSNNDAVSVHLEIHFFIFVTVVKPSVNMACMVRNRAICMFWFIFSWSRYICPWLEWAIACKTSLAWSFTVVNRLTGCKLNRKLSLCGRRTCHHEQHRSTKFNMLKNIDARTICLPSTEYRSTADQGNLYSDLSIYRDQKLHFETPRNMAPAWALEHTRCLCCSVYRYHFWVKLALQKGWRCSNRLTSLCF